MSPDERQAAQIGHQDAVASAAIERANEASAQSRERLAARQRTLDRLRADVPPHLSARAHLGVSRDGRVTQTFSGVSPSDDCGCGKPTPTMGLSAYPRAVQLEEALLAAPPEAFEDAESLTRHTTHFLQEFAMSPQTPPAAASPNRTNGGGRIDDAARALAARVERSRATFASRSKQPPIVLFDQDGQILGMAGQDKLQQPDGKTLLAAFDADGQLLGLIRDQDVLKVANPTAVGKASRGVAPAQTPPDLQQPQQPQMAARRSTW